MYPLTDRIADLSMIWKQVSLIFPYFDQKTVDWDKEYTYFLEKVMNTASPLNFHLLMAEFVNLLGDGHTDYSLPLSMINERGHLPFTLRMVENEYCIDSIIPDHAAHLGQTVISLNGTPFCEVLDSLSRYTYHVDGYIPSYRLRQLLPFAAKQCSNMLQTSSGSFGFDLLPEKPLSFVKQPLKPRSPYQSIGSGKLDMRIFDRNILYVRLDDFKYRSAATEISTALSNMPNIQGMIIDIRENIGGMTFNGAEVAKLLIGGKFSACKKRTRSMTGVDFASASQLMRWREEDIQKHIAAGLSTREEIEESKNLLQNMHFDHYTDEFGDETHVAQFKGPCILLTSRYTLSAAEDFVAMFKTNKRATIVGTRTSGTTGTPLLQTFKCGGRLRVCSVGYKLLDNTKFIGCGIEPDVFCALTPNAYRHGHDHVLDEALALLTQ